MFSLLLFKELYSHLDVKLLLSYRYFAETIPMGMVSSVNIWAHETNNHLSQFFHFCILLSEMIANEYLYLCAKYVCHQIIRNIFIYFLKIGFAHQMLRNSKLQSLIPNIFQNGLRWLFVSWAQILRGIQMFSSNDWSNHILVVLLGPSAPDNRLVAPWFQTCSSEMAV